MNDRGRLLWLLTGIALGATGAGLYLGGGRTAQAANDRYDDYVMCTGTVTSAVLGKAHMVSPLDGVWLLDYRTGKLLGTVIDRAQGKIVGWAELDLVNEFSVPPRQNVHFLMTTGSVAYNQSALYVAETTTGRFGVYTLAPKLDGDGGLLIRRHDLAAFRPTKRN